MKIRVDGLSKKYKENKDKSLDNINLVLPEKGLVFINGHNGSGKTTLINCLCLNDLDFDGNIFYDDKSLKSMNEIEKKNILLDKISIIYQGNNLIESMNGYNNLNISSIMLGDNKKESMGLSFDLNKNIKKLSGGERQKISICRALSEQKEVLILDEPTNNLDYNSTIEILELLKEISSKMLVICITHNLDLSAKYGDRIITLEKGKIIDDNIINENSEPCHINADNKRKLNKKNLIINSFLYYKYNIISTLIYSVFFIVFLLIIIELAQAFTFNYRKALYDELGFDNYTLYREEKEFFDDGTMYSKYINIDDLKNGSYYISSYDGIELNNKYDKVSIGNLTLKKYFNKDSIDNNEEFELKYSSYKISLKFDEVFDGNGIKANTNILSNIKNDTVLVNGIFHYKEELSSSDFKELMDHTVEYIPLSYYNKETSKNVELASNEVIVSESLGFYDITKTYYYINYDNLKNKNIYNSIAVTDIYKDGLKIKELSADDFNHIYDEYVIVNDDIYNKIASKVKCYSSVIYNLKDTNFIDLALDSSIFIKGTDQNTNEVILDVINYKLDLEKNKTVFLSILIVTIILFILISSLVYMSINKYDKTKHGIYLSIGISKRSTRISSYISLLPFILINSIISALLSIPVSNYISKNTLGSNLYNRGYVTSRFNIFNIIQFLLIIIIMILINYISYYFITRKKEIKEYFN